MQATPGTPSRNIVFFLVPFVFAIDLESGRIDNYDTTGFHAKKLIYSTTPWLVRLNHSFREFNLPIDPSLGGQKSLPTYKTRAIRPGIY
jgi:hypothetical protein